MNVAESTNSLFFPDEIVFEILTWLPVKSLCRFKCVSKSWFSTISATRFVDSHFSRSKSRPKLLIAISCQKFPQGDEKPPDWGSEDEFQHLFIADPTAATEQENRRCLALTHQLQIHVNANCYLEKHFPKSVAGLTWSPDFRRWIRITNPSTKSQVVFPREIPSGSMYNLCFSIGFDPIDSKYKVLEFLSKDELTMEYNVVNVGDYGNYRSVEDAPLNHMKGIPMQEICVNGVIYYIAEAEVEISTLEETRWTYVSKFMVAFDVRSEKFQVVEFFSFYGTKYANVPMPCRFMEFEGKVAIVNHPYRKHELEIWVLEDFENQDWSLMYSGKPDPIKWGEYSVVGSTFSGEVVFARDFVSTHNLKEEDLPFSLFFFDPKTGDFWSYEAQLPPGFEFDMTDDVQISVMGHVETLRSLT